MNENNYWGKARSRGINVGLIVRINLALVATLGSVVLGWALLSGHLGARATSGYNEYPTLTNPWGVTFDNASHIWIAEPGCNASPVCATPPPGTIGEYNLSNGSVVKEYTSSVAQNFNPVFVALDGSGNAWFTDPTKNAIGELVPTGSGTWTEWTATTASSAPYDLIFDNNGNIWFTEHNGNNIGFFNTTTHAIVETPTPTANSSPHGITKTPNGTIWFTENSIAKLGSFTPTANGTITITEHAITNIGPHLITSDSNGILWYSEGFIGEVGNFNPSNHSHVDYSVSNGVCPQGTPGASPPACNGTHISGIAVDGSGNVWFSDSLSDRVGFVNPATCSTPTTCVPTTVTVANNPHTHDGLGIDGSGNVWFTEQNNSKFGDIPAGSLTPPPSPTVTGSPSVTATVPLSPTASPPPSFPPGPVFKTWYFAEGRVGRGFKEYLTMGNPDPVNACAVNIQYMLLNDGGGTNSASKSVTVPAGSRLTESVNGDLNIPQTNATGTSISAVLTVNNSSTPACNGIVAERPMYFNALGVNSGDDVVGATQKATSFYFADVPTGGGYSSFITILNPVGGSAATVTAKYYANGVQVGPTQTVNVAAGARGTIAPNNTGLPQHVAAIVTSTAPVVVERPDYFSNINGGNAGTVSGAAVVVGEVAPGNDWLFAEGYTGPNFQENLVIANLDTGTPGTANVTVKLDYKNGTTKSVNFTLGTLSQNIFNVNTNNVGGASPEVSAEVTSTGAKIVVERAMFFHATFSGTIAIGGSEVNGQLGPGSHFTYSFAEGYTNVGYKEWLTLQNPTNAAETIYVTLVNGLGRTYTQAISAPANSRTTVDINALVTAHLVHAGDNYHAYEVSMTVQTLNNAAFVAERPMYWNASGTQGGSVAFGYIGGLVP